MSSGLPHKLYDYEVAPPAGAWQNIATALDEAALDHQFPSRLYNCEIMPPVSAWQNIAASLDEAALVKDYAKKLAAIAVAPPISTWQKIATSLGTEQEAFASQRKRIISPFIKYAAAAIIIGLLAWGGVQLFDKKTTDPVIAEQGDNFSTKDSNQTTTAKTSILEGENIGTTELAASLEEARNDEALEQSKKTYAKLDVTKTRNKIKNVADFFFVPDDYEPTGTRSIDIGFPQETETVDISNRYIMLMTPDGNIIRMSKKLSNLVCCVSGEEQDKECADKMKKWREKIGNPAANHSSGNVMDILSLVNALQDN